MTKKKLKPFTMTTMNVQDVVSVSVEQSKNWSKSYITKITAADSQGNLFEVNFWTKTKQRKLLSEASC